MKPTSTWRTIIELSSMNNNDEYVIHGDHEMKYEEVKELRFGMYVHPRLKLSRPVYDNEIDAGLRTSFRGRILDWSEDSQSEKAPKITKCLDALTHFHQRLTRLQSINSDLDPAKMIAHLIGNDFYDCMSGGASTYTLAMARELIERHNLDLNTEVYPGQERWHTFKDFLKEIEDIPRINKLLPESAIGVFAQLS